MERLGYDYETLKKCNSRIIFAQNSGFGPFGELSEKPSYDAVVQAFTGVMAAMGGGPSHRPVLL